MRVFCPFMNIGHDGGLHEPRPRAASTPDRYCYVGATGRRHRGLFDPSEDTIIVRRKTAFCISFAITAAELRCGAPHEEIYDYHEKFSHFVSNLLANFIYGF